MLYNRGLNDFDLVKDGGLTIAEAEAFLEEVPAIKPNEVSYHQVQADFFLCDYYETFLDKSVKIDDAWQDKYLEDLIKNV